MKIPFLNLFLPLLFLRFSIVADEGGGAVVEKQESAPETAPEQAAPSASHRVGIISQVLAGMKDKATLTGEIAQLTSRNQALEAQVISLTAERDKALGEKLALEKDFADIDQALKAAETTAKTVDQAAALKVVEAGFTAPLPGATDAAEEEETRETLTAKIAASTDDKEKWALCEKLAALG
jgi:vacuolar-type H+-ATPase subunit I/STV1